MKVGGNELFYVVLEFLFIHYLALNPEIILMLITALLVGTTSDFVFYLVTCPQVWSILCRCLCCTAG